MPCALSLSYTSQVETRGFIRLWRRTPLRGKRTISGWTLAGICQDIVDASDVTFVGDSYQVVPTLTGRIQEYKRQNREVSVAAQA